MRRLHFFQHEISLRVPHAAQARDLVAEHAPILFHVLDARLQQVVETAGHHVALDDLVDGLHRVLEALEQVRIRVIERDLRECEQLQAEPPRVQAREVAFDETVALEPADALDTRRQRQIDGAGELRDGQPAVDLEQRQDLAIHPVQLTAGFPQLSFGRHSSFCSQSLLV